MKLSLIIGAVLGLTAVILGAFGVHGLKHVLDAGALNTFEIAVRYQMYHALAILLIGALSHVASVTWLRRAAIGFIAGVVLFSGSLYLLIFTGQKWLGPITPLGGLCLMVGWGFTVIALTNGADNGADNSAKKGACDHE